MRRGYLNASLQPRRKGRAAGSHAERPAQAEAAPQQRNDRAAVRRSAEAAARHTDGGMTCQSMTAARRRCGRKEKKPSCFFMAASEAPNVGDNRRDPACRGTSG